MKFAQSLTTKNKMMADDQCCLLQTKSFLNILAFSNSSIDNERHCTDTLPFCFSVKIRKAAAFAFHSPFAIRFSEWQGQCIRLGEC